MSESTLKAKLNTRLLRKNKIALGSKALQMLTCYDYQTAVMLNETEVDLLLVGDSLGNVMLGYETTVEVTLDEMEIFSKAVRRGAPNKFIVTDMPFGTYSLHEDGVRNGLKLFQNTKTDSLKLEGATTEVLSIIKTLTSSGVPVMGHIGLTPQSVHELGGYYTHGKTDAAKSLIMEQALNLEKAGCFSIVLECVDKGLSKQITNALTIPTIGIGAGLETDGQVLVINDLLKMGKNQPPKFCSPIANLFDYKKSLIQSYLTQTNQKIISANESVSLHN